jgi:hypothetical protein
MGHIYKNSSVTIAAEAIDTCEKSFFDQANIDRGRASYPITISCRSSKYGLEGELSFQICPSPEGQNHLSHRAWTFQEQTLSPRLLLLNSEMICWKCREKSYHEDHPLEDMSYSGYSAQKPNRTCMSSSEFKARDAAQFTYEPNFKSSIMQLWSCIIWDFTRRGITYSTDRLPAILGIAKENYRHQEWTYLAGLWKEDIHMGLLWSTRDAATRPRDYVAPSWSWAALDMQGAAGKRTGIN